MGASAGRLARPARIVVSVMVGLVLSMGLVALYEQVVADHSPALSPNARQLLHLVNAVRAQSRCPPLRADPALTAMAQAQAQDMVARGFLSTVNPSNEDATVRARRSHYPGMVTEDFAAGLGTPTDVVTEWTNPTNPSASAIAGRLRTCGMVSAGIGFDAGTVLPSLAAHVWVLALGDR